MSSPVVRLAVITSDNRFCRAAPTRGRVALFRTNTTSILGTINASTSSSDRREEALCGVHVDRNSSASGFWWLTAALNSVWARVQQYDHLVYCVESPCVHPDSGEVRSAQWCKLVAIADVIASRRHDYILYLDSDAYWVDRTRGVVDGLVRDFASELLSDMAGRRGDGLKNQFGTAADHATTGDALILRRPSLYFGCNSPWDACGVQWNRSAPFARRGSANSGVVLLRADASTYSLLRAWWHARNGWARPNHVRKPGVCTDQAVLWRLWSSKPGFASMMRVMGGTGGRGSTVGPLGAPPGRSHGKAMPVAKCMSVVGPRRRQRLFGSPIEHIVSLSPRYRQRGLADAWVRGGEGVHDPEWCVTRVRLEARRAAVRLFGSVGAAVVRRGPSGPWFEEEG